jgi:hypothetical protein
MAGNRPGPLGTSKPASIDTGTSNRSVTPPPASVGVKVAHGGVAGVPKALVDPVIEALKLRGAAKRAAYALKKKHPDVIFTSGFRTKEDQARAMASNVILNRKWIEQTYVSTAASRACQAWVDRHPDATSQDDVKAGLLAAMNSLKGDQVAQLSRHLTGDAFDVKPVVKDAVKIKKSIRQLTDLLKGKFLEKEGGLVRWHAQFP